MPDDLNPIFDTIFDRAEEEDDLIIAYIAYGLYKEQKREFITQERNRLGDKVPQDVINTFHRTYNEGQIELIWEAAATILGRFAVNYAEGVKEAAVKDALKDALKGNFWRQVLATTAATFVFAIGTIALYFLLRLTGFDLIDQFHRWEQIFTKG